MLADCACTWDRHRARRYGSYGTSIEPGFDQLILPYLDRGMIYAIAHVRGGGEMGRYWYDQTTRSRSPRHGVPHPHMLLHLPSQVRRAGQIPHQAHHVRRFHFMRRVPGLPLGMRILSMFKCIGNRVHAWLRCWVLRCRKPLRRKLVSLLRLCDCATDRDWIHETVNARCRRFSCACESYVSIISVIR